MIISALINVPNSPKENLPIWTSDILFSKLVPNEIVSKLPTAAVSDIANGDKPIKPALNPFVRAFTDKAEPKIIDSSIPISLDLSKSAISGLLKIYSK